MKVVTAGPDIRVHRAYLWGRRTPSEKLGQTARQWEMEGLSYGKIELNCDRDSVRPRDVTVVKRPRVVETYAVEPDACQPEEGAGL